MVKPFININMCLYRFHENILCNWMTRHYYDYYLSLMFVMYVCVCVCDIDPQFYLKSIILLISKPPHLSGMLFRRFNIYQMRWRIMNMCIYVLLFAIIFNTHNIFLQHLHLYLCMKHAAKMERDRYADIYTEREREGGREL